MNQHILKTNRLTLIPLTINDINLQIELDTDPNTMQYLGGIQSIEACKAELENVIQASKRGLGYWAGYYNKEFIGFWILCVPYEVNIISDNKEDLKADNETAELGYRLLSRFWRQGFAKEGSLELIKYGFEQLNLKKIIARTSIDNYASQATMSSVGLTEQGKFVMQDERNTEHQGVQYAISAAKK